MKLLRIIAAVTAAALAIVCSSCSGSKKKRNSTKKGEAASVTQAEDEVGMPEGDIARVELPTAKSGKYITRVYELMQSDSYSLRMTYTNFEGHKEEVCRVVDGENYYQLQTNDVGQSGSIRIGDQCYDFDLVCGIYRKTDRKRLDSIIESTVENDLPKTSTHINAKDSEKYEVEEYTYTGNSYITVVDFYFDKATGVLVKYTVSYMVESPNGDEEMTEVRYIREIISDGSYDLIATDRETTSGEDDVRKIDTSVFDPGFMDKLVDFDNMTEDQRLGYCQAIFVTAGVTADELAQAKVSERELRVISYDEFTSLVYNYFGNDE